MAQLFGGVGGEDPSPAAQRSIETELEAANKKPHACAITASVVRELFSSRPFATARREMCAVQRLHARPNAL